MSLRVLAGLLLGWACFAASAAGAIYKHVDAQGRAHFSDQPRPGWTRVDVRSPVLADEPADASEAPAAQEAPQQTAARAAECARKEEQLRTYRHASTIVERDALGREKEYSDEERAQLIARHEQDVQACRQNAEPAPIQ